MNATLINVIKDDMFSMTSLKCPMTRYKLRNRTLSETYKMEHFPDRPSNVNNHIVPTDKGLDHTVVHKLDHTESPPSLKSDLSYPIEQVRPCSSQLTQLETPSGFIITSNLNKYDQIKGRHRIPILPLVRILPPTPCPKAPEAISTTLLSADRPPRTGVRKKSPRSKRATAELTGSLVGGDGGADKRKSFSVESNSPIPPTNSRPSSSTTLEVSGTIQPKANDILDLQSPQSILGKTNLKGLVNLANWKTLGSLGCQMHRLISLLPAPDAQAMNSIHVVSDFKESGDSLDNSDGRSSRTALKYFTPSSSSILNNEFLSLALVEWKSQLIRGEFKPKPSRQKRVMVSRMTRKYSRRTIKGTNTVAKIKISDKKTLPPPPSTAAPLVRRRYRKKTVVGNTARCLVTSSHQLPTPVCSSQDSHRLSPAISTASQSAPGMVSIDTAHVSQACTLAIKQGPPDTTSNLVVGFDRPKPKIGIIISNRGCHLLNGTDSYARFEPKIVKAASFDPVFKQSSRALPTPISCCVRPLKNHRHDPGLKVIGDVSSLPHYTESGHPPINNHGLSIVPMDAPLLPRKMANDIPLLLPCIPPFSPPSNKLLRMSQTHANSHTISSPKAKRPGTVKQPTNVGHRPTDSKNLAFPTKVISVPPLLLPLPRTPACPIGTGFELTTGDRHTAIGPPVEPVPSYGGLKTVITPGKIVNRVYERDRSINGQAALSLPQPATSHKMSKKPEFFIVPTTVPNSYKLYLRIKTDRTTGCSVPNPVAVSTSTVNETSMTSTNQLLFNPTQTTPYQPTVSVPFQSIYQYILPKPNCPSTLSTATATSSSHHRHRMVLSTCANHAPAVTKLAGNVPNLTTLSFENFNNNHNAIMMARQSHNTDPPQQRRSLIPLKGIKRNEVESGPVEKKVARDQVEQPFILNNPRLLGGHRYPGIATNLRKAVANVPGLAGIVPTVLPKGGNIYQKFLEGLDPWLKQNFLASVAQTLKSGGAPCTSSLPRDTASVTECSPLEVGDAQHDLGIMAETVSKLFGLREPHPYSEFTGPQINLVNIGGNGSPLEALPAVGNGSELLDPCGTHDLRNHVCSGSDGAMTKCHVCGAFTHTSCLHHHHDHSNPVQKSSKLGGTVHRKNGSIRRTRTSPQAPPPLSATVDSPKANTRTSNQVTKCISYHDRT